MALNQQAPDSAEVIRIGNCDVIPGQNLIVRDGQEISINPRTMSVLKVLIDRHGQLVSGQALLDEVWPANHVSGNTVYKAINELREAFGDSAQDHRYIETKSRRGYRLVAAIGDQQTPKLNDAGQIVADENRSSRTTVQSRSSRRTRTMLLLVAGLTIVSGFIWIQRAQLATMSIFSRTPQDGPSIYSVALLRFKNLDNDPELSFLAEEFPGALVSGLSHLSEAAVIGPERTSTYSSSPATITEIAGQLGVNRILGGSYHKVGDEIAVTASLFDGQTGAPLFELQEQLPLDQSRELVELVASNSLRSLTVFLDPDLLTEMRNSGTHTAEAFLRYQEAMQMRMRRSVEAMEYAVAGFEEATQMDPGYVIAYSRWATTLGDIGLLTFDPSERLRIKGEISRLREIVTRMDPDFPTLAAIKFSETRMEPNPWHALEADARRHLLSTGKGESNNFANMLYADYLISAHLFEEAAAYLDTYAKCCPEDPLLLYRRATLAAITQGPRQAIPLRKKNLLTNPDDPYIHLDLITQLGLNGNYDEADRYLDRLRQIDQSGVIAQSAYLYLAAYRGDLKLGSSELADALANEQTSLFSAGLVYLILGDVAQGIELWRQQPPEYGEVVGRFTVHAEEYALGRYANDPRYQQYLEERGIGRSWTAYMRQKVSELAPITGVQPSDPSGPQPAYSG